MSVTQPLPTGTNSIGQVTANAGTGTFTVGQATGTNLHTVVDSGTITANAGTGTFTVGQATGTNLHTVVDSGTITANIGTTGGLALNTTVLGLQVTQGSPTAGQNGTLVQGAITTAAPTYTDGQTSPLSLTTTGALRVDTSGSGATTVNQGTSPWVDNITQIGGSGITLGQKAMAASLPVVIASDQTSFPVTGSGNFTVVQPTGTNLHAVIDSGTIAATQSGTWTVQPGNTANTTPWLTTISQGGNAATVSAGGALKVDGSAVTQPVSGTVTANIGTTGGLALDATVAALQVAQASTTAGQNGTLVQGAVTTAAPTYTTGQTSPLSLTTTGALRVDATVSGTSTVNQGTSPWITQDGADGPVTPGTVAGKSILTGIQYNTTLPTLTNGQQSALQGDSRGRALVTASNFPAVADTAYNTVGGSTIRTAAQIGNANGAVDFGSGTITTQTIRTVLAINQTSIPTAPTGLRKANTPVYNDYSSTNITTAAYVQLVASTTDDTQEIEIFDSSGQALYLAVGAAASEVNQMIIFPGGNGRVRLQILAGSRVSAKAITATANTGFLAINLYAGL